jgi:HEAT repeat protein
MTVERAIVAMSVVLGALLVVCVVVGVAARLVRRLRERRRIRSTERIRPLVMASMADPQHADALPTTGRDGRAMRALVVALLPKLRGADRNELASILRRGGQFERAHRDLRSRSSHRRIAAADLLGAAGDTSADAALADLTRDSRSDVRVAAVRALGRLGTTHGAQAVIGALSDERVPANTCTMALLRMGRPAGDALLEALAGPSGSERCIVADLLGVLGTHEARQMLEDMFVAASDPNERRSAAMALGRLGDPLSAPLLIEVLEGELARAAVDHDVAIACVEALGLIGDRRAIPILTQTLARSHRLSFAAAEALAPMGPRRSRRSIRERDDGFTPVTAILSGRSSRQPVAEHEPRVRA